MHFTRQFQGRDQFKLQLEKSKYWHICKSKRRGFKKKNLNSKNLVLHVLCKKGGRDIQRGDSAANNERSFGPANQPFLSLGVFMLPHEGGRQHPFSTACVLQDGLGAIPPVSGA